MCYNISVIEGKPSYESLPALKLINFPKGNCYKPFTQVKPAINGEKIYIRFLVFEAKPEDGSTVSTVLKNGSKQLFIECGLDSCTTTIKGKNGKSIPEQNLVNYHHFEGEDLQGIYWGVDVSLPLNLIYDEQVKSGSFITGNFYKYSKKENPHHGSLYPADFSKDLSFEQNLGKLNFMEYEK